MKNYQFEFTNEYMYVLQPWELTILDKIIYKKQN